MTIVGTVEKGKNSTPAVGAGISIVTMMEIISGFFDLEMINLSRDLEVWLMRLIGVTLVALSPLIIGWGRRLLGIKTRRSTGGR